LGPTIPVIGASNGKTVGSAKDLNPAIVTFASRIGGDWVLAEGSAGMDECGSMELITFSSFRE
jgi:hypothetical protein